MVDFITGAFLVSVKSIIVSDCLIILDIVGFFFKISGFRNRLNFVSVLEDDVAGFSSINLVKSASVAAAVDSTSTTGNSGNSGSCGVKEGFLSKEKNMVGSWRKYRSFLLGTNFIH